MLNSAVIIVCDFYNETINVSEWTPILIFANILSERKTVCRQFRESVLSTNDRNSKSKGSSRISPGGPSNKGRRDRPSKDRIY